MTRHRLLVLVVLLALGTAAFAAATRAGSSDDEPSVRKVAIRDDCDPTDPAWNPTGGCLRARGDVTNAEFAAELSSPLSTAVVGHQAWRNDPSYLKLRAGDSVRVANRGGRGHTFTEVANFGGGKIPNGRGLSSPGGTVVGGHCAAPICIPDRAGDRAGSAGI